MVLEQQNPLKVALVLEQLVWLQQALVQVPSLEQLLHLHPCNL